MFGNCRRNGPGTSCRSLDDKSLHVAIQEISKDNDDDNNNNNNNNNNNSINDNDINNNENNL